MIHEMTNLKDSQDQGPAPIATRMFITNIFSQNIT